MRGFAAVSLEFISPIALKDFEEKTELVFGQTVVNPEKLKIPYIIQHIVPRTLRDSSRLARISA